MRLEHPQDKQLGTCKNYAGPLPEPTQSTESAAIRLVDPTAIAGDYAGWVTAWHAELWYQRVCVLLWTRVILGHHHLTSDVGFKREL